VIIETLSVLGLEKMTKKEYSFCEVLRLLDRLNNFKKLVSIG
jgi:hypothetical protein